MNATPERPSIQALQDELSGVAHLSAGDLDIESACRQYAEDGYEVTPQLREFLQNYGEITVTWQFRDYEVEVTTATERTLESAHATPRNARIFARKLGQPIQLIGTAFDTEDCVLLAEDGGILLYSDAGYQRVANGFEAAIHALVTGDWDKTFFHPSL